MLVAGVAGLVLASCRAARSAMVAHDERPSAASTSATSASPSPQQPAPPALADEAREALELLRFVLEDEGRDAARELLRETVAALSEPATGAEESHAAYLIELDGLAQELGSLEESRKLQEGIVAIRERLLPKDHPDLLGAKQNLGLTRFELGDVAGARELFEAVLEARTRLLPPDHISLLRAKVNVGLTRYALGDLQGARELFEAVLEVWTRQLPPTDRDLLTAKQDLAATRNALGDLRGAHELFEEVLEARARVLPPDHPDLLLAKQNLAVTRASLGDLAGARELEEAVLEARTRLLPPDHPDLLQAKQNLAATRGNLGDLRGARELFEEVLEALARILPGDNPDLLQAKQNLAGTKAMLGDLAGARELQEAVLEARTRLLPPDHPDILSAKVNLGTMRYELGDVQGARELFEDVLEARTRLLPPDHPDILLVKLNLGSTRSALGDLQGARELQEEVLEARTRQLPPDHPELLTTKMNLGSTMNALGDVQGARELFEEVLEARSRLLPSDHPDLLVAKQNLAVTRRRLGDLAGARELEEAVLEAWTRLLPSDHPDLLRAKQSLAATKERLGDVAGARELLSSMLDGMRLRARALRAEAARPAREGARAELRQLFDSRILPPTVDSSRGLEPELFATVEDLRLASVASADAGHALAVRPELDELARDVAERRTRLNDLAAAGAKDEGNVESWRRSVLQLAEERDRAERELRGKLAEAGAFVGEIDAKSVAARLAPGAAVTSFLRYPIVFDADPQTGAKPPTADYLLAFVVKPGGGVTRVELGPAQELEELAQSWRRSLGKPIERGIAAPENAEDSEAELGRALRGRILDPVLAAAGADLRALHVVLDDFLFLVPLDALPLEGNGRVGEQLSIHVEATLARLLRGKESPPSGTLVTIGGIDFDAEPKPIAVVEAGAAATRAEPLPEALHLASTPPSGRFGRPELFEPLRQTRYETEDVAAQYKEALGGEPVELDGTAATKAALFAAAPRARFLHLATHGWFASEAFKSQLDSLDEQSARASWQRAEETLTGFAPETLCGLALAGANRGKDSIGRVPGILTAEELASFDLRNCELAVLSACETNVGIRRAGQGIQSLQTALHAAGARTAITSLWKVDDAATRRLFELFYTKLWKDKLGKADALWQAKMALRAEAHPPRDWAGWVLSGDPN